MKKLVLLLLSFLLIGCGSSGKKEAKKEESSNGDKTTVSFVGVGDNLIHEMIYQEGDKAKGEMNDGVYDFSKMYANVKDDITKADLAYIDQESIVGGDDKGISGYPTFNTPSDIVKNVADVGFDMINTANNHCLDKYEDGIAYSKEIWDKQKGVITAGTYTSQEDRETIRTIKRKGITFSFLAYTYGTNGIEPPNSFNVAYFDEAQIEKDVAKAKKMSDVVIVSAHWGDENVSAPNEYQQKYAKLFADLEVDVVVGEHPHTIQPVEWIKGEKGNETLVIYSLGNFLNGMLEVNNVLGGMIRFDFVKANKDAKVKIENVKWEPIITHYSGDATDILNTRKDFAVYKLSDYTDILAKEHGLNGYEGQSVNIGNLYERTKTIIKEIPVVEKR